MSGEIIEHVAPSWLQPPAIKTEEQVIKEYEDELVKTHIHEPPEPIHLATSSGMRRALMGLGVLDDAKNSEIVQKAKKRAKVHRRIMGVKD